jgi:beta-galactosidase/beta-glucuronidase
MDLDLKRIIDIRREVDAKQSFARRLTQLTTVWGDTLDPGRPLPDHPRPSLERGAWTSLNGTWNYAIVESTDAASLWSRARPPQVFDGTITVPFSPEAALSGVGRTLQPTQLLWYHRQVSVPALTGGRRCLIHFEAVDYACAVYMNGRQVCCHTGGYLPFDVDVTDAVHAGSNILMLCVYDPQDTGKQMRGKQSLTPCGMWYTAQSGIWQSVWMEVVDSHHVTSIDVVRADAKGAFEAIVTLRQPGSPLTFDLVDADGTSVVHGATTVAEDEVRIRVTVPDVHLWSCDDPYLYEIRVSYGDDRVKGRCGFRTIEVHPDERGVPRLYLNGERLFVRGLLDQGYWPDGLMTAPADDALAFDLEAARDAGFNLVRMHAKVECERFYHHADRLGILVLQDMVPGGEVPRDWTSANTPTLFRATWARYGDTARAHQRRMGSADPAYQQEWLDNARQTISRLSSHPSVVIWCAFNESWGQFRSAEVTRELKSLDPDRLWVATSGWYDQGAGDIVAIHNYFRSLAVYGDPHARAHHKWGHRAFMLNEFGGITYCPPEHVPVDDVYGYYVHDSLLSFRDAMSELLDKADDLEAEGLSGFVYTQVSDIEEEMNGILTYDRRVNKIER